ncbi:sensor histidine kinase [Microbacterium sp. 22242]|uniref:sensor histidine kinase n=1 Tax=Microbacterium sp. 22242 TaxID=3453896 RepID=UPI003F8336D5
MRHARSLRLQVVLIASALVAAVSIVVGVVSVVSLNDYLLGQLDGRVAGAAHRGAEIVGGALPHRRPGTPVSPGSTPSPQPSLPGSAGTTGTGATGDGSTGDGSTGSAPPARDDIVGAPGQSPGTVTAIYRDGSFVVGGWIAANGTRHDLSSAQRTALADQVAAAAQKDPGPITIDLGGSLGPYRVAARTATTGAVVVTGLPLDQVTAATGRLLLVVTLVGIACIALAIVAAALAMGRALRPLRRVAGTAAGVTAVPLDRGEVRLAARVDARDLASTAEVGQVGAALNDLLDHVEQALSQREASESTMRRFVADASHELRTPLATIRAYAQLSGRPDVETGEIRGNASLIDAEGVRMSALIDQLLLLARLDALPEVASEDVDLRLLVAEAVLAARLAGPDHTWVMELGETPAVVRGDAADLRRVVDNLLGNARVHTPAGTTVRVRLAEEPAGSMPPGGRTAVRLTVADDGPGLADGVRETVFERFARGEASRSREGGGTGLGMAIARAVVEAHGGTIALGPGPGATFVVVLPAADPEVAAATSLDG